MQCETCATDNPAGSKFCTKCGISLSECPSCGRSVPPTARFCSWCGVAQDNPASPPGARGERKQATVLFADIVGSTEMIADLDAEQAFGRLQPTVAAMADVVRRFDGTVLGLLGDGLKAAFGAPRAQEGHALLACQAALAMQNAISDHFHPIRIRIGLHSGEVVAGALVAGASREQDAQGVTLHIASRIEQAAEPGEILLSGACRDLVATYCDTQPAGIRRFKGIPVPVEVFSLIGLKSGVASDRFRDESLVPMLGRQDELEILKQALLDADRRRGSAIGIAAPPGVGKSRLCYEFGEWCRDRQIEVFEARAHVFGKATPLLPMLELVRALFRITPMLDPVAARRRVEETLLALDPSFADDVPFLADFLGLPAPELEGHRVEPKIRQARLRSLVQRMLKSAGPRASVIIFEDLHWLDQPSLDFLETIVEAVSGTRFVIVLNFRPTWACPWSGLAHYRQLSLSELGDSDIERLVHDLVGDDPSLRTTIGNISRQSDGNPFFAEELVRALAQRGDLTGERGSYRLAASAWNAPVLPATIEAAIGARIDLLAKREKTVLQIGAVIGKEYPASLARKVAGLTEQESKEVFGRLCDLDLIKSGATIHGPGFTFRHPLIQEVSYAMQLRSRKAALHAAVADAIAQSDWGLQDEFAALLAHHCEASGNAMAAARHVLRSAAWVGRTNATEAFGQSKRARLLLRAEIASQDVEMMRAMASSTVLTFGWRVGMTADEAAPYAEEALRYAREFAADEAGSEMLMQYGRFKVVTGSADDYATLMEEALAMASTDLGRIATIQGCLAQAHWMRGFLSRAESACNAALETLAGRRRQGFNGIVGLDAPPYTSFDVELWINCLKAQILLWLGRFDEASGLLAEIFEVEGTKREAAVVQYIAHLASVELACHRQDADAAHQHAERVRAYADQSEIPYLRVNALFASARGKMASGQYPAAVGDLQAALDFATVANAGREYESYVRAELSYAQYRGGRFEEAVDTARVAIEMARHRHQRLAECLASMVLGAGKARDKGTVVKPDAGYYFARAEELVRITGAALLGARLKSLRTDSMERSGEGR